MACKALDVQFPLILPNSCFCAQGHKGRDLLVAYRLNPYRIYNQTLYQNAFSGNIVIFFLGAILGGAQLGRNIILDLKNTSPAPAHNHLYVLCQFCN